MNAPEKAPLLAQAASGAATEAAAADLTALMQTLGTQARAASALMAKASSASKNTPPAC
jgi:glutamate-5-semialdehyde dehydrogenase